MPYWRDQEFKALQRSWYERLIKEGFRDAEESIGDDMRLKHSADHALVDVCSVVYESRQDYFKLLAQYAADEDFRSEVDEYIMVCYAGGTKIKDILQGLANSGEIRCRETIRFTVRRYEAKWGLKVWSRKELNIKSREMSSYRVLTYSALELPQAYEGLIYAKWLRSLRYGNDFFRLVYPGAYWKAYRLYLENILRKPDCRISLAVLSDDHDVVLGFSVSRDKILDYIYVFNPQRKQGIGKALVPKDIEWFTHVTTLGLRIWADKCPQWKFNPFG